MLHAERASHGPDLQAYAASTDFWRLCLGVDIVPAAELEGVMWGIEFVAMIIEVHGLRVTLLSRPTRLLPYPDAISNDFKNASHMNGLHHFIGQMRRVFGRLRVEFGV